MRHSRRLELRVPMFLCAIAAATTALALGAAAEAAAKRPDPTRLLFLIEYVGSDYDKAVSHGAVIDQMEYGEMLRFTRQAVEEYGRPGDRSDEIAVALDAFAAHVARRAETQQIRQSSRALLNLVSTRLEGIPTPAAPPDLQNGARLYASECAKCHGDKGDGKGPGADGLDPPPVSFRGERMNVLSPRHVFNTLTLGIEDTAMVSFAATRSEPERWDLAFYVMTLREGFRPDAPAAPVRATLEELAASTNAELLDLLHDRSAAATASTVDYVRANPTSIVSDTAAPAAAGAAGLDSLSTAMKLQEAFATAADRIKPSIVGIASYEHVEAAAPPATGKWQADTAAPPDGMRLLHSGSGFVLPGSRDVATADHLLRRDDASIADAIRLDMPDGSELEAHVVGMEPALDLAILRITEVDWTPPEPALGFADSEDVRTGNWLIALGDPPGARTTFAVGIASSPAARQCYQEERSATMLQSSLVIAPGGVGGPVGDIEGNVVGMSVELPAIPASPSGPAEPAQGAVLPANLLLNLHVALDAAGSTESPWLGVSVLELGHLRARLGEHEAATLPAAGVFIDDVFDPSPATRAGVRRGDFLVRIGENDIASVADFQRALYLTGIGKEARLGLLRDGKPVEVSTSVELRPPNAVMR